MIVQLISAAAGYLVTQTVTDKCGRLRKEIDRLTQEINDFDQVTLIRLRQRGEDYRTHPDYLALQDLKWERRGLAGELLRCEGHPVPPEFDAVNKGRK